MPKSKKVEETNSSGGDNTPGELLEGEGGLGLSPAAADTRSLRLLGHGDKVMRCTWGGVKIAAGKAESSAPRKEAG
jgi:hypothetical protein